MTTPAARKRASALKRRRSAHSYHLKKNYGITIADYDRILAAQGGRCAICKGGTSKNFFATDHNHKTGVVRGLLCARCNGGLAKFMDSTENLERALQYMADDGAAVRAILSEGGAS